MPNFYPLKWFQVKFLSKGIARFYFHALPRYTLKQKINSFRRCRVFLIKRFVYKKYIYSEIHFKLKIKYVVGKRCSALGVSAATGGSKQTHTTSIW